MANYVIEGTIRELSVDENDNFTFKISGAEGFSIKQAEKEYNLLCPEKLKDNDVDNKPYSLCFIISQDYEFSVSGTKNTLVQYGVAREKMRFVIKIEEHDKISKFFQKKSKPIQVSSIKILMD